METVSEKPRRRCNSFKDLAGTTTFKLNGVSNSRLISESLKPSTPTNLRFLPVDSKRTPVNMGRLSSAAVANSTPDRASLRSELFTLIALLPDSVRITGKSSAPIPRKLAQPSRDSIFKEPFSETRLSFWGGRLLTKFVNKTPGTANSPGESTWATSEVVSENCRLVADNRTSSFSAWILILAKRDRVERGATALFTMESFDARCSWFDLNFIVSLYYVE